MAVRPEIETVRDFVVSGLSPVGRVDHAKAEVPGLRPATFLSASLSPNPMCAQVNNEAHRGERQPDAAADQDGAGGAPEQAGRAS